MRIRRLLPLLALLLALPAPAGASNPIPGVGIVVKRNPGSSTALVVPGGFFGAGSSAFSGTVSLEGRCSHDCGGCADVCATNPDSRIDYASTSLSGPFDVSLPPTLLYSTSPISVSVGGSLHLFDVVVALSGQSPVPGSPVSGQLLLAPGGVLDPGSSAIVLSSSFDLHQSVTFVDRATGQALGSSLELDVQVSLQEQGTPIACVADGTPTGHIVLGQGSSSTQTCTFSSADGSLVLSALSVVAPPPSTRASGLVCTAVGGASISPSSSSSALQLRSLRNSGLDGVDIDLQHLDGHIMSSSSLWSTLDQGTTLSYEWRCSLNGLPPGTPVIGTLSVQHQSDRLSVSCDLSHFSSSATQMRCLVYAGDQLVFDSACPVSTTVDLLCPASSLVPEVSFELDNARRFSMASVSSSNTVLLFGGQSVACDRVVFVGDLDDDGALDVCAMRATVPPSSSLHDLDFDSQSVVLAGQSVDFRDMDEDCDGLDLFAAPSSLVLSTSLHVTSSLLSNVLGEACDDGSCSSSTGPDRVFAVSVPSGKRLSSKPSLALDPRSPFVLDASRASDDGVALTSTYHATSGGSASLSLQPLGGDLLLHTQFSSLGLDHEELVVLHHGAEVARLPLALDGSVSVAAPPGSPSGAMVSRVGAAGKSRSNVRNNLTATVEDGLREDSGTPPPASGGEPGPTGAAASSSVSLGMEFLFDRVFCAGGTCATGDAIIVEGSCSSGTCGAGTLITITGADFSLTRSSGSWPTDTKLAILALPSSSSSGSVHAVIPASVALSSTRPVVHVPVEFDRDDVTAARGTTVTLQLSPNLVLAGAISEQDYFSRSGQSQMFVVDNGGGSYTVDCALLGAGCGPTDSGTLFDVPIARAPGAPDGFGTVSVVSSEAADCNGAHLTASPGGPVTVVLSSAAPPAVTGLAATQVMSGNDVDGTTQVSLIWSPRSNVAVELYRAGFGNYPEYDDAPNAGSLPPLPSYPPAGRWSPVALQCGGTNGAVGAACTDEPSSRDFFYYVAFARDAFGNVSPASDMTTGTLDYHLGDVSNGVATCAGDNAVGVSDISLLGAHYGATVPNGATFACLDVGPTSTGTVQGRPLTDNRVSFADFILFAINYSLVSSPGDRSRPAVAPANALSLVQPELPEPGATFDVDVRLAGAGDLQGLSAQLAWDAAVVEPIGVASGELMDVQGRQGMVLSGAPGGIDAALLGTGPGIAGSGSLARVTFRVRAAGDPAIRIASVFGRDLQNHDVTIANASAPSARTALRLAFPNPFVSATTVVFSLGKTGPGEVGVFDLAGRRVRTLASGVLAAGEHTLSWDGRDGDGHRLNAGVYMLRLQTAGHQEVRSIRLVR
ncbi:MAG: FlgD immunoglobulin-like domain containing protein [Candidatus Eisenbacteria bacterium]